MTQYKLTNRILAAVVLLTALVTYVLTLQPSVPFWDCGEFTAAAVWQQVPHPPGAPMWLIVGKMFHLLPFGDPGWRINLFSAVSSSFAAMLVYLISVLAIERWRPFRSDRPLMSYLPTFGGALIGALAFIWSDTNWFNSVESEVYAAGSFLVALLVWLMMRWDRAAEKPGHERYLLLSAYLLGVAIGVHLLALLVVPGIALVIYFRHYQFKITSFLALMGITTVTFFLLIYQAPLEYIPKLIDSNAVIGVVIFLGLVGLTVWARRERKSILYIATLSFLLLVLGYTSYTQILLRASSHPPMNENEPDTFSELVGYLGREQYGDRPIWPRRVENKAAHKNYGTWYPPTDYVDGSPVFDQINTSGELNFLFRYQSYHMYFRYLFWNFVGRVSDEQDAGVALFSVSDQQKARFIDPTGYTDIFPVQFYALPLLLGILGIYYHYKKDWKMAFTFTALFLLLGIVTTLQQNQQQPQPRERDYFYVGSFMIFTMWIGFGATGLAEEIRKKRHDESDEGKSSSSSYSPAPAATVLAVCLIAAPINMAVNGWEMHDRAGNWAPWDYPYNILQSCEQDAILFTNGDNDTFPVWYLQDVAGVRRDVRVVNLSLGNTLWYVWQLKNERPWGAKKVPLTFPDDMLRVTESSPTALSWEFAPPPTVEVDVPADVMAWATDGVDTAPGKMSWVLQGESRGGGEQQLIRVQDKLIRNIIENNNWERPIYFSTSVGPNAWAGLEDYFRWEGMAYRVMPVKQTEASFVDFSMNMETMRKCLMNTLESDESYTEPHYGFKFRNFANPDVFFQTDHRRLAFSFRRAYIGLAANELYTTNSPEKTVATLNKLEETISPDMFGLPYWMSSTISDLYMNAGATDKAQEYARRTVKKIDEQGNAIMEDPNAQNYNPLQIKAKMLENLGDYDGAIRMYEGFLQQYPNDARLRGLIDELTIEKYLSKNDTAGAIRELQSIIKGYEGITSPEMQANLSALQVRLLELTGESLMLENSADGTDTERMDR